MTMSASRPDPRSKNIKVSITYGPVTASVEEDPGHLRHFWSELGKLLDQIEHEAK